MANRCIRRNVNTVAFTSGPLLGHDYVFNFHGDIAEVLIFNRGLSSDERDTVGNYFMTKYNLSDRVLLTRRFPRRQPTL